MIGIPVGRRGGGSSPRAIVQSGLQARVDDRAAGNRRRRNRRGEDRDLDPALQLLAQLRCWPEPAAPQKKETCHGPAGTSVAEISELENLLMKVRQDTARFCCGV